MIDKGQVIEIKGDDAVVRVFRGAACGNCNMCGLSSEKKFVDVTMENCCQAAVGDDVEVSFSGSSALKVSAIVYLMPLIIALIMLTCGYFLGLPDWSLILIFVGGLGLGFFIVRYIDKNFAKNMDIIPKMIKIIKENENEQNS